MRRGLIPAMCVGMSREQMDKLERLLVEVCTDVIKPPIRPIVLRRELDEGLPFLLVENPSSSSPRTIAGARAFSALEVRNAG